MRVSAREVRERHLSLDIAATVKDAIDSGLPPSMVARALIRNGLELLEAGVPIGSESGSSELIKLPEVLAMTGLSRATVYLWVSRGQFPAPVQLGPRRVAWRKQDIAAWLSNRPKKPVRPMKGDQS